MSDEKYLLQNEFTTLTESQKKALEPIDVKIHMMNRSIAELFLDKSTIVRKLIQDVEEIDYALKNFGETLRTKDDLQILSDILTIFED